MTDAESASNGWISTAYRGELPAMADELAGRYDMVCGGTPLLPSALKEDSGSGVSNRVLKPY
jgi:hypothetical protein